MAQYFFPEVKQLIKTPTTYLILHDKGLKFFNYKKSSNITLPNSEMMILKNDNVFIAQDTNLVKINLTSGEMNVLHSGYSKIKGISCCSRILVWYTNHIIEFEEDGTEVKHYYYDYEIVRVSDNNSAVLLFNGDVVHKGQVIINVDNPVDLLSNQEATEMNNFLIVLNGPKSIFGEKKIKISKIDMNGKILNKTKIENYVKGTVVSSKETNLIVFDGVFLMFFASDLRLNFKLPCQNFFYSETIFIQFNENDIDKLENGNICPFKRNVKRIFPNEYFTFATLKNDQSKILKMRNEIIEEEIELTDEIVVNFAGKDGFINNKIILCKKTAWEDMKVFVEYDELIYFNQESFIFRRGAKYFFYKNDVIPIRKCEKFYVDSNFFVEIRESKLFINENELLSGVKEFLVLAQKILVVNEQEIEIYKINVKNESKSEDLKDNQEEIRMNGEETTEVNRNVSINSSDAEAKEIVKADENNKLQEEPMIETDAKENIKSDNEDNSEINENYLSKSTDNNHEHENMNILSDEFIKETKIKELVWLDLIATIPLDDGVPIIGSKNIFIVKHDEINVIGNKITKKNINCDDFYCYQGNVLTRTDQRYYMYEEEDFVNKTSLVPKTKDVLSYEDFNFNNAVERNEELDSLAKNIDELELAAEDYADMARNIKEKIRRKKWYNWF